MHIGNVQQSLNYVSFPYNNETRIIFKDSPSYTLSNKTKAETVSRLFGVYSRFTSDSAPSIMGTFEPLRETH